MSVIATILKLFIIVSFIISVLTIPINDNLEDKSNNLISDTDKYEESDEFNRTVEEFDDFLNHILGKYYDEFIASKHYTMKNGSIDYGKYFDQQENQDDEKMLADVPSSGDATINSNIDSESLKTLVAALNKNNSNVTNSFPSHRPKNFSSLEKNLEAALTESDRNIWISILKNTILVETGRVGNKTSVPPSVQNPVDWIRNRTDVLKPHNDESDNDDVFNKRIRSYYPSCTVPRNTDEEAWKDANTMNLYFNVDYSSNNGNTGNPDAPTQEETVNIASATLRLYRLSQENNATFMENCKTSGPNSISDDDKQIRVSIYWYARSLKKHKVAKRKLADSRMVPMYKSKVPGKIQINPSYYVEFNVRPAAKTWVRGRNLGLGVVVEDVDGLVLNAAKFFKGVSCDTVGNASTPKPIPTAILDAHRQIFGPGQSFNSSEPIASAYNSNLPNLEICTVELIAGLTQPSNIDHSKIMCKMLKSGEETIKKMHHEAKTNNGDSEVRRHIRHQHHLGETDFRDKFVSKKIVMKNTELRDLQLSSQNISQINR